MTQTTGEPTGFRQRFLNREHLVGTFCKIPTTHPIEMLGGVGFDFVIIDQEHGPWDRVTTDAALLAARASGTAGIVRVPELNAARILAALDDGAAGVMVPHVYSAARAREVVDACRYRGGRRGFANTTRAGGYGAAGFWAHVEAQDLGVAVIAMIEDREAIDEIEAILAVDGIDGIFIGRGDLTAALGAPDPDSPQIMEVCDKIMAAARKAGKPIAIMAANGLEVRRYREMGASTFIIGSDQGFLRGAAGKAYAELAAAGKD